MKLVIIGWRPWSVAMRYRSLIVNAKRLGHKVFGISTGHYSVQLVEAVFKSLEVRYVRGWPDGPGRYMGWVRTISPNAFFGEQYWSCLTEKECKKWVDANGRKRVVMAHGNYWGYFTHHCHVLNSRDTIAVTNEAVARKTRGKTEARVAVVGAPELDVLTEPHDIKEIRERLGASIDQPLVAVFPTSPNRMHSVERQNLQISMEPKHAAKLMGVAEIEGWKVAVHLHPSTRSEKTSIRFKKMVPYLRRMQDRGAVFASSVASGRADGIGFIRCNQAELAAAADAIVGSSTSMGPVAYAAGKRYFYYPEEEFPIGVTADRGSVPAETIKKFFSMPNFARIDGDFSVLAAAIAGGDVRHEQDDRYIKKVFHRLDGKCWQRLLGLV